MEKQYKKTILLVDDQIDVINAIEIGLSNFLPNTKFLQAHNGQEALKIVEQITPDLILLDIMMPVMDGWDTANKIKSNDKLKKVPIIFLTAKCDKFSKTMGKITAEDYIEKPYDLIDLYNRVCLVLNKSEKK